MHTRWIESSHTDLLASQKHKYEYPHHSSQLSITDDSLTKDSTLFIMRYQDYIDAFNHNADQDAKAQFFTEDVRLSTPLLFFSTSRSSIPSIIPFHSTHTYCNSSRPPSKRPTSQRASYTVARPS